MLKPFDALWARASTEEISEGRAAYPRYRSTLQEFANFYGFGFVPVVEAFAALSPNNDYHGNLRSLASCLSGVRDGLTAEQITVTTYRACAVRAMGYLRGDVSFLDTVRGPKIRAFRHNILYPATSTFATVDGHMIAAWHNREDMTMKAAASALRGAVTYDRIAADLRAHARRVGLPTPAAQAVLWIARRRILGLHNTDQTDLFHTGDAARAAVHPRDFTPYGRPSQ